MSHTQSNQNESVGEGTDYHGYLIGYDELDLNR